MIKLIKHATWLLLALFLSACVDSLSQPSSINLHASQTPMNLYNRILSYHDRNFIPYHQLIKRLNDKQVIFLGEQHDSQRAHEYQLKILASLYHKDKRIAVAMEMFERDVQPLLDRYLGGIAAEPEFKRKSRPWPNYQTDYRPLVEFAKDHKLKVIAMNTPRRIARNMVQQGLKAIFNLSPAEKNYIAQHVDYNDPIYKAYFMNALPKGHSHIKTTISKAYKRMMKHFTMASALKDATMAESINSFFKNSQQANHKIVSINGRFHSDYGLAIPKRLKSRYPRVRMAIITFVPLSKGEKIKLKSYLTKPKIADFIVFTDDQKSYH